MQLVLAALAILSAPPAAPLLPNETVAGGGTAESDGLAVGGVSLWARRGEPAVAFATSKRPGADWQYAYVLLVKGDHGRTTRPRRNAISASDGRAATSDGFLEINGVRVDADYRLEPAGGRVETIRISGTTYDAGKGRVFLIDLSGKVAAVEQVALDLPKAAAKARTVDEIEAVAKEHLARLKKSEKVTQFLK